LARQRASFGIFLGKEVRTTEHLRIAQRYEVDRLHLKLREMQHEITETPGENHMLYEPYSGLRDHWTAQYPGKRAMLAAGVAGLFEK
jgi:hypothetical protein